MMRTLIQMTQIWYVGGIQVSVWTDCFKVFSNIFSLIYLVVEDCKKIWNKNPLNLVDFFSKRAYSSGYDHFSPFCSL